MDQGEIREKSGQDFVFHSVPHINAAGSIRHDSNLAADERRLLLECLHIREQDRDFRAEIRQQAELDRQTSKDIEQHFIDRANSWHPLALWYRFISGDMFGSSRDLQARDRANREFNVLSAKRGLRLREHNKAVQEEEARMRGLLAGSSPYAKRVFNTLVMSTTTRQHFPAAEIRAASHLPNPLERILLD